ncbi:MAG: 3-hydroxyacyl-CoA dehydrogenase NAD-binding domain-containing protein [Comamonadaceae bacterium]|nr:3-hydroxyacyl-CoA dehydrogenase NAD-binding domain-containing protein [Comamonadaceae bacterium]
MPEDAALHPARPTTRSTCALLGECDLVIEAIAERMDWKLRPVPEDRAGTLAPHAIVASNTSGLSITKLAEALPEAIQPRFCGIHFFNPPRYMALVELIATPTTRARGARPARSLRHHGAGQGRGARARTRRTSSPTASASPACWRRSTRREKFGLSLRRRRRPHRQEARPRQSAAPSAPPTWWAWTRWRTSSRRCRTTCADDPFFPSYATPPVLKALIEKGALGQKAGAGFYKKVGKDILRLDPATGDYVPSAGKADDDRRAHAEEAGRPSG